MKGEINYERYAAGFSNKVKRRERVQWAEYRSPNRFKSDEKVSPMN